MTRRRTVVLDAMGVIYRAQDDVAELLVPFVKRHGSQINLDNLSALYEQASLGLLDVDDFWRSLGLDPSLEDEYLAGHELNDGLLNFLTFARNAAMDVWCLSNDVSRWSLKLRERFELDELFVDFVISGDIGFRKPSVEAYRHLIDQVGRVPDLFVDDRSRNVKAAQSVGIRSILFGPDEGTNDCVCDFKTLATFLDQKLV